MAPGGLPRQRKSTAQVPSDSVKYEYLGTVYVQAGRDGRVRWCYGWLYEYTLLRTRARTLALPVPARQRIRDLVWMGVEAGTIPLGIGASP